VSTHIRNKEIQQKSVRTWPGAHQWGARTCHTELAKAVTVTALLGVHPRKLLKSLLPRRGIIIRKECQQQPKFHLPSQ